MEPANALEENRRLRRTMRDLVALSTLPAVWTGLGTDGIARSLADVLLNTLSLDLVYVRLAGLTGEGVVEVVRSKHQPITNVETVRAAVAPLLGSDRAETPSTIPDPSGAGTLHVTITRFGIGGDHGVLVTGSSNPDFPTERDRLLLGVGANQTAIVVQRSRAEQRVAEQRERLRTTLASIGDGVITTDTEGRITNLNAVAESLTGWKNADAVGQPLDTVFRIVNETTRQPVENPARRALQEGVIVGLANHTVLIRKDGTERPIDDSAAPIRCEEGEIVGCVLVFRDVTERRKADAALRESELRYRLVGQAANDAIWDWDLVTNRVVWNEGVRHVFGYTEEQVGPEASWWLDHIHPDDRDRIAHSIHGVIVGGGELWQDEYRYRRADGSYAHVLDRGRVVRDGGGRPVRMVGSMLDLTERMRTEAKLREKDELLRLAQRTAEAGLWDYTIATGEARWSEECHRLYGTDPATFTPSLDTWLALVHPDDREEGTVKVKQAVESRDEFNFEFRIDHPAKGQRWLWEVGKAEYDDRGQPVRMAGITMDITDRKRAENQLRDSERRLASELAATTRLHALSSRLQSAADLPTALDDVLVNAIETCGANFGNIQLFNPQTEALEIVAQRGFRADFLDYFRTVRMDEGSACAQAMQSGERIVIEDVELDPTYKPHLLIAAAAGYRAVASTPLIAHDGVIVGMLSVHFRSPPRISERDERLLDLYARHAADLIERFRFVQALKDADRRKDEFLATLAHELRNPLAPIRNAIQIMKMSDKPNALEEARTRIERQVGQMVRLVDDLMDVSRISRNKLELKKERVELARVVENAIETSRPLIDQMGHHLTVKLPSTPVYVEADVTRLAQVFLNLLNNSAKYTEPVGRIWLTAERQGSDVVVSVRDNGIGIPPDKLGSVFELFSQVEGVMSRSQGGLGIGLSLVKRLVEMHDGSIEAKSGGPGKGSTFTVRLPVLVEASRPHQEGERREEAIPKSMLRILIVDDNRDSADSLGMMLRLMGNDITTAYDGEEAVAVAGSSRPDVTLLDIGLPKLNGYEACRRIREQRWSKGMVLIALTGWGQEEDVRRSHEAGFDHHMVKPVDPQALMKLLAGLQTVKK